MMPKTCYWCGAPATGREHVPPKCFYPEEKDLGRMLKGNRITVPSCDVHNSKKSMDDEYLMCVLAANLPNNPVGQSQAVTKVRRALVRSEGLRRAVLRDFQNVLVQDLTTGEFKRTGAFRVDPVRIQKALEHMARALYYHEYGRIWHGEVRCIPEFLINMNEPDAVARNSELEELRRGLDEFFGSIKEYGDNPEVFSYQFKEDSDGSGIAFRFMFYGGSKADVALRHNPSDGLTSTGS